MGPLSVHSGDLLPGANATFQQMGHAAPRGAGDEGGALQGWRAMLRLGFGRLGLLVDEGQIALHYPILLAQYEAALAIHTRLYDGAEAAVQTLHARGFACAICTNKPTYLAERLLAALGIRPLFGALIGAGRLPVVKPNPRLLYPSYAAAE